MGKTIGRPVVRFNRGRPPPKRTAPAASSAPAPIHVAPASGWTSIDGAFEAQDIYDLAVRRAARWSRFVEVTGGTGRSTCFLAECARQRREIRIAVVHTAPEAMAEFSANLERVGVLSSLDVRTHSADGAVAFGEASLSFVFLDAPAASVEREMAAWWSKVERGGMLSGSNYEDARSAVDAFVAAQGLGHALRVHKGSWILHKSLIVDAMYCINLAARADRRQAVEAQFRGAGLADRVEFFEAVDGRQVTHPRVISNGQAGCLASHLGVIGRARERGQKNVLIFEDDVQLAADFAARFPVSLSRCPASYDLLYVGAICVAKWGHYIHGFDEHLARAGRVSGSHAYMVNTEVEPRMRGELAPMRVWYDEYLMRKIQPERRSYVCVPYLASQVPGLSDVSGTWAKTENFSQYVYR
jgi:hypothetical protein